MLEILTQYRYAVHCEQVNEDVVDSDHGTTLPDTPARAAVIIPRQSAATATTKMTGKDRRGRKMSLERDLIDPLARRKRDVSPIA